MDSTTPENNKPEQKLQDLLAKVEKLGGLPNPNQTGQLNPLLDQEATPGKFDPAPLMPYEEIDLSKRSLFGLSDPNKKNSPHEVDSSPSQSSVTDKIQNTLNTPLNRRQFLERTGEAVAAGVVVGAATKFGMDFLNPPTASAQASGQGEVQVNSVPNNTVESPTGQIITEAAFVNFWLRYGLGPLGWPIEGASDKISPLNNQSYKMQLCERVQLELHPENAGTPYEVLLSQLGTKHMQALHPKGIPQELLVPPSADSVIVKIDDKTTRRIPRDMYNWWVGSAGGSINDAIRLFGLPLHEGVVRQVDPTNGRIYESLWLERMLVQRHPENAPPNNMQGALLGSWEKDIHDGKLDLSKFASASEFDIGKDRHIEEGNNWTYSSHNDAPMSINAIDKNKLNEGYSNLPPDRKVPIYIAKDKADAEAIAKYYKLDITHFQGVKWRTTKGLIQVGMEWDYPEFVQTHPVPTIYYFDSLKLKEFNTLRPGAIEQEILASAIANTSITPDQINTFWDKGMQIVVDNTNIKLI